MSDTDFYHLYKTLHVLAVVLLAGGITIDSVIGPLMARATNVQQLRAYTGLSRISENFIIPPALLFLVGFGYATAGRANYDLDMTWLLLGQILTLIAVLVTLFYFRPLSNKLDRAARAAPDGPIPDDLLRELKQPLPPAVGMAMTVVFIVIVYLMVSKPGF